MGITLDTGALIAAERRQRELRSLVQVAAGGSELLTVPTVAIAQSWRNGARQANLAQLLSWCKVEPLDENLAKRAGELMAHAGTDDAIDAIIAQSASLRRDIVLTSDPTDFGRLAAALGGRIKVVAI